MGVRINGGVIKINSPTSVVIGPRKVNPFSKFSLDFGGTNERLIGASTLSTFDNSAELTVSFWIKGNVYNGFLFGNKSSFSGTSAFQQFAAVLVSASSIINFGINVYAQNYVRGDTTSLLLNEWNHIFLCYNSLLPLQDRGRVYINGSDVTVVNIGTSPTLYTATSQFVIASLSPSSGGSIFTIDEFAIWGTDQRNILNQVYNNGTPTNLNTLSTVPTHWWRMGENAVWDGTNWTIPDENGGYDMITQNMEQADRVDGVL